MNKSAYIGLLPLSKGIKVAALSARLDVVFLGDIVLDDLPDLLAETDQATVAVASARRVNAGLMGREDFRDQLNPKPYANRWVDCRAAEYELHTRGISVKATSAEPDAGSKSLAAGYQVWRVLENLDKPVTSSGVAALHLVETHPDGAYTVLLGRRPFPKTRLEGRLQRQLYLYRERVDVPDPMRVFEEITSYRLLNGELDLGNLRTPQELDALMSAFVAQRVATRPNACTAVGDEGEGQIVLPVGDLQARYE